MLNAQIIIVIITIIPVYQLLFYTIQLITFKKSTNIAQWYLGLLLLCLTSFLIIKVLFYLKYNSTLVWAYYVFVPLLLLPAPLFYKYILSITSTKETNSGINNNLILFMPAIIIFILNIVTYGSLIYADKIYFLLFGYATSTTTTLQLITITIYKFGSIMAVGQVLYYTIKSIIIINNTKSEKENNPLLLPFLQINWIKYILFGSMIFISINAIAIQISYINTVMIIVYNIIALFTGFVIGNFALKQENLYKYMLINSSSISKDLYKKQDKVKRKSSKTGSAENIIILDSLKKIMISEKPYLNSKLSIDDLADTLKVSKRYLSNVINDETGTNVYGFINDYRINEFKRIIKNPKTKHLSIEGLSEKVGFNSKSSFNACFKKATGYTPSQFIKKNRVSKNEFETQ